MNENSKQYATEAETIHATVYDFYGVCVFNILKSHASEVVRIITQSHKWHG